jgi:hypothetical protein
MVHTTVRDHDARATGNELWLMQKGRNKNRVRADQSELQIQGLALTAACLCRKQGDQGPSRPLETSLQQERKPNRTSNGICSGCHSFNLNSYENEGSKFKVSRETQQGLDRALKPICRDELTRGKLAQTNRRPIYSK